MIPQPKSSIRPATKKDIPTLSKLIKSGQLAHKHLDWRSPLDRINESPFLIMQKSGRLVASLACPPDPPKTAWIQLFLSTAGESSKSNWNSLLQEALKYLKDSSAKHLLAIPIYPWFSALLEGSGFREVSRVIVLNLNINDHKKQKYDPNMSIRDMQLSDISELEILDRKTFGPVWHNTEKSLMAAFNQAYKATVLEDEKSIIGYQISTLSQRSVHLARLAVLPKYQTKGIGSVILSDLIFHLKSEKKEILSVNTQNNNICSINLYKKFGFQETNEFFPVFSCHIS